MGARKLFNGFDSHLNGRFALSDNRNLLKNSVVFHHFKSFYESAVFLSLFFFYKMKILENQLFYLRTFLRKGVQAGRREIIFLGRVQDEMDLHFFSDTRWDDDRNTVAD